MGGVGRLGREVRKDAGKEKEEKGYKSSEGCIR